MLQAELITGLEALAGWSACPVFVGLARKNIDFPYALVLEQALPQFGSTASGTHPTHTHSGFQITVYAGTQQKAKELAALAVDWLRDLTGKLVVTGNRFVEASDIATEPQDGMEIPEGDSAFFLTSFEVHFIHKAA